MKGAGVPFRFGRSQDSLHGFFIGGDDLQRDEILSRLQQKGLLRLNVVIPWQLKQIIGNL